MFEWQSWTGLAVAVALALAVVLLLVAAVALVVRVIARHHAGVYATLGPARRRFRILFAIAGAWIAVAFTLPEPDWRETVNHVFLIAVIACSAWVLTAVVTLLINRALIRYPLDDVDNRAARRIHTQMLIVKRLAVVVIAIVAVGSILLTFPGAQAVGTSLLASAGLASVVAGLAAQSTLANVFAGVQLAFSGAIRVDDVVIAEGNWGRIEEITLTYVVVRIWDERRLVLPSTYFTTTPFENWTRTGTQLLGSVELDLDWRVSLGQMREKLNSVLESTELWDGRTGNVQVTDAVGGFVRVRVLVSAANSGALWDLQSLVREEMVEWLQGSDAAALPRTRVLMVDQEPRSRGRRKDVGTHDGLFSGSPEAEERGQQFTGAVPVVEEGDPSAAGDADRTPPKGDPSD